MSDVATGLETCFEKAIPTWWSVAKDIASEPGGDLAAIGVCSPSVSDFGLMLGWSRLVEKCDQEEMHTLVICDDPWLFRHLVQNRRRVVGPPPALLWPRVRNRIRGIAARLYRVPNLVRAALLFRGSKKHCPTAAPAVLAYGHPRSRRDGYDAYFGTLLSEIPEAYRIIHTDADYSGARQLIDGTRNFSLHGWGTVELLIASVFSRWRPSRRSLGGPYEWLIRRAASKEGATAIAMTFRWQDGCQKAWMRETRPRIIAWPWENHAWERRLVEAAKKARHRTLGYQHTVVGRHAANHSPGSNPDYTAGLPDVIVCNGPAAMNQLKRFGVPKSRMCIGGALREFATGRATFDPSGPIYVALPMAKSVALEMLSAIEAVSTPGLRFAVKRHPMMQVRIPDTRSISETGRSFHDHEDARAVLFAATTVGLEALLAGLPTYRFIPKTTIAIDILSPPASARPVTAETLETALTSSCESTETAVSSFFSPPDMHLWRTLFRETNATTATPSASPEGDRHWRRASTGTS